MLQYDRAVYARSSRNMLFHGTLIHFRNHRLLDLLKRITFIQIDRSSLPTISLTMPVGSSGEHNSRAMSTSRLIPRRIPSPCFRPYNAALFAGAEYLFFITRSRRGVRASDCAAAGHSFRNVRSMLGKGKINSRRVTMDPPAEATIVRDRLICLWKSIDLSIAGW